MFLLQAEAAGVVHSASWLTAFRGVDLLIVALMIVAIVFLWKTLPKLLEQKYDQALAEATAEKSAAIIEYKDTMKTIGDRIGDLEEAVRRYANEYANFEQLSCMKFESMSKENTQIMQKLRFLTVETLKKNIQDEKMHDLERLFNYKEYLKAGLSDENIEAYGIEKLIKPNPKDWLTLTKGDSGDDAFDKAYYLKTLARIKKIIRGRAA